MQPVQQTGDGTNIVVNRPYRYWKLTKVIDTKEMKAIKIAKIYKDPRLIWCGIFCRQIKSGFQSNWEISNHTMSSTYAEEGHIASPLRHTTRKVDECNSCVQRDFNKRLTINATVSLRCSPNNGIVIYCSAKRRGRHAGKGTRRLTVEALRNVVAQYHRYRMNYWRKAYRDAKKKKATLPKKYRTTKIIDLE